MVDAAVAEEDDDAAGSVAGDGVDLAPVHLTGARRGGARGPLQAEDAAAVDRVLEGRGGRGLAERLEVAEADEADAVDGAAGASSSRSPST